MKVKCINDMKNHCPLCDGIGEIFYKNNRQLYYECSNCKGIFASIDLRLNFEEEKTRYNTHNNDVNDIRYQKFVNPIFSSIIRDFTTNDKGLDFGAGTGPVISKLLGDKKYQIKQYDPFFHNYPELLEQKYNYIACCEVIEHFYNPKKEFATFKKILQQNGKLYCMTDIYNHTIDFDKWYYKNDPTHVFIYQKETFEWIKNEFNFSDLKIDGKLITLTK